MSSSGAESNSFTWITILISVISIAAGAVSAFVAKAFKSGKKEATFEGTDKLFHNMLTNTIKEQVAIKEDTKNLCTAINAINLRLTKLETIISERDRFQRGNDPVGYGAFRDRQEEGGTERNRDKWR